MPTGLPRCPFCCSTDTERIHGSVTEAVRCLVHGIAALVGYPLKWCWRLVRPWAWPIGGVSDSHANPLLASHPYRCRWCGASFDRGMNNGKSPHCGQCGCDLMGNTSGLCPECGWSIPHYMRVLGYYESKMGTPGLTTKATPAARARLFGKTPECV